MCRCQGWLAFSKQEERPELAADDHSQGSKGAFDHPLHLLREIHCKAVEIFDYMKTFSIPFLILHV